MKNLDEKEDANKMGKFIAGIGIGMAAGAAVSMMLAPPDKKKMRKTPTGRMICNVMDGVEHVFD